MYTPTPARDTMDWYSCCVMTIWTNRSLVSSLLEHLLEIVGRQALSRRHL